MNPRVQVLLSTFNGERFLPEQLASLRAQTLRPELLIRDDGSSDSTPQLLRQFAGEHPELHPQILATQKNLGVLASFFTLLQASDPNADYFAFSDQDDIWLPNKLAIAVAALERLPATGPRVYASRLRLVDAQKQELGLSDLPRAPGFGNALVENIATGCSVVFDRRARELVLRQVPQRALMHDWWLYLLATGLGHFVFDPEPRVLYRQHGANVVGATANPLLSFARRVRRFALRPRNTWHVSDQAAEFLQIFGEELAPVQRQTLAQFVKAKASLAGRLKLAFGANGLWRQSRFHSCILRMLIFVNRF